MWPGASLSAAQRCRRSSIGTSQTSFEMSLSRPHTSWDGAMTVRRKPLFLRYFSVLMAR